MSDRLCIARTYFDYQNETKCTWYSCNKKKTMKVNDYVFTEKYVQKYIRVYIVKLDIYLDSDHRIIITSLHTTVTCKTCRRPK